VKIIAHRGYSAKFSENTLAAFQAAMDVGADMIEFDVSMSKDRVPVIMHDETLNRTTNGLGKVAEFTLKELKKLQVGTDQVIPTLEEVLQLTQGKIPLHIEIKTEAVGSEIAGGVEELTLQLIEKYGFSSTCIVSSFSFIPLLRIRKMNSEIAVAITFDHTISDIDKNSIDKLEPSALHLPITKVTTDDMDYASVEGLPVNVYTVNTPVAMKHAEELCVEGIFTNEVEKALQYFTGSK
jgi:glycerophosphoryl diester phosphodiesterase